MKRFVRNALGSVTSYHFERRGGHDVLLYASPRGGSTWMTELIFSLPGFAMASEPLNVRRSLVQRELGLYDFADLSGDEAWKKIQPYYARILSGKIPEFRTLPLRRYYRPITWRTAIKENQGGGDFLGAMEDAFGCKILHCLRHPIAVALSREVYPLLNHFKKSRLRDHFSPAELKILDAVIASDSKLMRGVAAWCIHHRPPLRDQRDSWFVFTYEATVLNPEGFLTGFADFLGVEITKGMRAGLTKPSGVARKSDPETQNILQGKGSREALVSKWTSRVSDSEKKKASELLSAMGIELYSGEHVKPAQSDLIFTEC